MNHTSSDDLLAPIRGPVPASPAVTERLRIAGRSVLIRYGDQMLAELLTRSMRHLRDYAASAPDLSIDCWTVAAGLAASRPGGCPVRGLTYMERGTTHLTWDPPVGPLVIYDRERHRAWIRFGPVDSILNWEVARPFRKILHWWAADCHLQYVHAAAVGSAQGGLLLAGRSGSGKSTTALACLASGMAYAGDDYCLVEPGGTPYVHGLYLSGLGNQQTAELIPALRNALLSGPRLPDDGSAKHLIYADDISPSSVTTGFPLRAIVVPQITGGATSQLLPISPFEALRALAPSTVLQLPGKRGSGLARIADLVRNVPSWKLNLGRDPATAVDLLNNLIVSSLFSAPPLSDGRSGSDSEIRTF